MNYRTLTAALLALPIFTLAACNHTPHIAAPEASQLHSVYISQAQYETGQPAWNANHGDLLVIIMNRTSVSDMAWVKLCSEDMAGEPTVSPQGVAQCESTDF